MSRKGKKEPKTKARHILATLPQIKQLVSIYYDIQDVRIRSFNRLRKVGVVKGVDPALLRKLEAQIKETIQYSVRDLPIVNKFLKNIHGIGPIIAGGLVSIFDPHKAQHVSSFWKYAGLHVVAGKAVKRKKGEKVDYNPRAHRLAWIIGDSFLKHQTPFYSELYEKAKQGEYQKIFRVNLADVEDNTVTINPKNCSMYTECFKKHLARAKRTGKAIKEPPCRKHIHYRALRVMVKRFLADLWSAWRSLERLPVNPPYAVAELGHANDGKGAKLEPAKDEKTRNDVKKKQKKRNNK